MTFGSVIILLVFAIVLILAVMAIIRGIKGIKMSKRFETTKKVKFGYWMLSAVHMWVGILITLCYLITGILILTGM